MFLCVEHHGQKRWNIQSLKLQKVMAFARIIELSVGGYVTCSFMLHAIYEPAKKMHIMRIPSEYVVGFDPTIFPFCC